MQNFAEMNGRHGLRGLMPTVVHAASLTELLASHERLKAARADITVVRAKKGVAEGGITRHSVSLLT